MEIKKEDFQDVETSNNLITTLTLGTTQGSGVHQMQAGGEGYRNKSTRGLGYFSNSSKKVSPS